MKKLIIAAVAAATAITGTAAPALANSFHDHGRTVAVKQQDHRWSKGQRFDHRYARAYRVISSPRTYRLYTAPRGYHWVQSGHDAVLVGITSGIIAAVMANAIR
jgi:Ni/Co efflux regulator RcnB